MTMIFISHIIDRESLLRIGKNFATHYKKNTNYKSCLNEQFSEE